LKGGDEGGLRDFDLAELAHLNNATRWFGHREFSLAGREITGKFSWFRHYAQQNQWLGGESP
jgi:hypothetical protein